MFKKFPKGDNTTSFLFSPYLPVKVGLNSLKLYKFNTVQITRFRDYWSIIKKSVKKIKKETKNKLSSVFNFQVFLSLSTSNSFQTKYIKAIDEFKYKKTFGSN